jgi:cysteine desulfurase
MFRRVYLDNAATTPVDTRVVDALLPFLTEKFGNASSIHFYGQAARSAVDRARHQTASLIGARPNEIIFTSGGTESNNLAIRGLLEANRRHGSHVITTAIEHPAVGSACVRLEESGCEVSYVGVGRNGQVDPEEILSAVRGDTVLITVMTANNEIGTVQPVAEIGGAVKELREKGRKIWFHTDAVQAVGKIAVNVDEICCDLLSMSGHKIYAPKGVGALFVRKGVRLAAQNLGGHQERGRRGGTENVALIAALGAACEIAAEELAANAEHTRRLRDQLETGVKDLIPEIAIHGVDADRLPNISNISFSGVEGEGVLINLDMSGIAVSTGSACSSGSIEPSHVIVALGVDDDLARGAVRFSFGRENTEEDVAYLLGVLPAAVRNLRKLSPRFQTAPGS